MISCVITCCLEKVGVFSFCGSFGGPQLGICMALASSTICTIQKFTLLRANLVVFKYHDAFNPFYFNVGGYRPKPPISIS